LLRIALRIFTDFYARVRTFFTYIQAHLAVANRVHRWSQAVRVADKADYIGYISDVGARDAWIEEVRDAAANERLALICGAGISSALSGDGAQSTWIGLIKSAFDYLGSLGEGNHAEADDLNKIIQTGPSPQMLVACAEWVKGKFQGLPAGEYKSWLQRTVGSLTLQADVLSRTFAGGAPLLTTNYDFLLEELTGREPLTWTEVDRIEDYHSKPGDFVFHLHGHYRDPRSVIFGGSDYGRLESAKQSVRLLEPLAHSHTYLLAGFGAGLDDPNFMNFLAWFRDNFEQWTRRIYVLTRDDHRPEATLQGKLAYLSYGPAYSDLPQFLADLLPEGMDAADARKIDEETDQPVRVQKLIEEVLPAPVIERIIAKVGPITDLTDFQQSVLDVSFTVLSSRSAALISAVTGTGKTTMSRVAMNAAIGSGGAAVMLLPTKALVAQEVNEWNEWIAAWERTDRHLRVYGSSRDYPEHDSPVSKGRFEVAIAIYEKLGAYLVAGQSPLANTRLLVVDELQTLVEDKERAAKLEGLLTMIRLMGPESRPAVMGLSATLSRESTELLQRWLGVGKFSFVQTSIRPVPLDTIVMDGVSARRQPDAHLLALGEPGVEIPPAEESRHEIGRGLSSPDLAQLEVRNLSTGSLAATLTESLLLSDKTRRILVFVPGRTAAQDLALGIQRLLNKSMGAPRRQGSPWAAGRFASASLVPEEAELRFNALLNSDLPLTDDMIRGLRHGVAYHSARLPAAHRRLLEQEFRDPNGILRILVATDTLAIGVNLTADTVIATSISGYSSGGQSTGRQRRLLSAAELDNKGGRAGRLGQMSRERGEFYILVPDQRDLEDVLDITAQGTRHLSTIDGVFDRYVLANERTPRVVGRITELDDVARLVLQVLCADGFGRREEALDAKVEAVLRGTLAAQNRDMHLPSVLEVLERLRSLSLIVSVKDKIRPSRLGAALGRSGLTLSNASTLERLARLATGGAGDIDLLYNAFRSGEMDEVTAWVALPKVAARHYPSLKENVITYALAYCAESPTRRRDCATLLGVKRHPFPAQLVESGSKVISRELKQILDADVESLERSDATALLRAVVAFEWSRGVPFAELKARFSTAIRSEEVRARERPVELKLHYSDIEQLCEQVAGVIRSAAEVSFSASGVDFSNRMRTLALQVETGLPAWLAPIAKMRMEQLHRNRLASLWDYEPVSSGWASILDLPPLIDHRGLSETDRADARRQLEVREQRERLHRHRVNQRWASETIPGMAATFEEIGQELDAAADGESYLNILCELAHAVGISYGDIVTQGNFSRVTWNAEASSISLCSPESDIGSESIEEVRDSNVLVMLRTHLLPGAYDTLSMGGMTAKFVQPEQLLSLIARFSEARGEAVNADEIVEALLEIRVSALDADSWSLFLDQEGAPPPFSGQMPPLPDREFTPDAEEEDAP
jgi:ATP-dependent RNA helicase HelY